MAAVTYSEKERAKGQRVMILEGVFSRAMEGVTGGVVLAGFALALGASDFEIGLVAAIPFLAQLAHVPTVAYLARFPDRKGLALWGAIGARLLFFAMALLPFLALPLRPIAVLVPLLVAYATLATFSGGAWQVWVRELVPREGFGRYFGRRMAVLSAIGLVTVLAAGQFLQRFPDPRLAFGILFALGGTLGLVSAAILSRAPSRVSEARPTASIASTLRRPVTDSNYRRLLVFLGAWGFAANIALPFLSVMLLRTLGFGFGVVTILAAVSQVANIAGLRLWAPLTDRFGNKPVLGLAGSVFLVGMSVWAFVPKTPESTATLILAGVVHVLLGFALAGLDIASNGIVMKLAPEDDAPAYLASASVAKALATGVAPLLGGFLATLLADRRFSVRLAWGDAERESVVNAISFVGHEYLFLLSIVLCLYALHRLLAFREEGEAPPEQVVRAMRREVAQVGSVAGLRQFAHAASYLVEASYRFERSLDVRRALELDDDKDSSNREQVPGP